MDLQSSSIPEESTVSPILKTSAKQGSTLGYTPFDIEGRLIYSGAK